MKLSSREVTLGLATLGVVLAALTWKVADGQISAWKQIGRDRAVLKNKLIIAEKQAARRPEIEGQLRGLLKQVPEYPAGQDVSVEVLKIVRGAAHTAGLSLVNSEAEQEKDVGDLHELEVKCTWQGSLDALVQFLFDVQSRGLLLDVRALDIRPPRGATGLSGSFSVACAYTRSPPAKVSPTETTRRSP